MLSRKWNIDLSFLQEAQKSKVGNDVQLLQSKGKEREQSQHTVSGYMHNEELGISSSIEEEKLWNEFVKDPSFEQIMSDLV